MVILKMNLKICWAFPLVSTSQMLLPEMIMVRNRWTDGLTVNVTLVCCSFKKGPTADLFSS